MHAQFIWHSARAAVEREQQWIQMYPQKCSQVCICALYIIFSGSRGRPTWHIFEYLSKLRARKLTLWHVCCKYHVLEEWDGCIEKWELEGGGGIRENERRNLGKETREEQQEGKVEGPGVTWRQRRWINQPAAVTLRPSGPATARHTLPQKHHSFKG